MARAAEQRGRLCCDARRGRRVLLLSRLHCHSPPLSSPPRPARPLRSRPFSRLPLPAPRLLLRILGQTCASATPASACASARTASRAMRLPLAGLALALLARSACAYTVEVGDADPLRQSCSGMWSGPGTAIESEWPALERRMWMAAGMRGGRGECPTAPASRGDVQSVHRCACGGATRPPMSSRAREPWARASLRRRLWCVRLSAHAADASLRP